MNKFRIKIGDRYSRVVGREKCTTLSLTLVGGDDWEPAELWVESYLRENEEIKERLTWTFPKLLESEKIEIELDVEKEPDKPDEIDQRHGKLLPDPRLVVKEGIRHSERMIEELKLVYKIDSEETKFCMFCGRPREEVNILIGGPITHICNKCLDICNEIAESEAENDV